MQIETKSTVLDQFGWTFRVSQVDESADRVLLLLHGWTGDENSMWAFMRNAPPNYAIIAPRAPYLAPKDKGGYSWREMKPGTWGSPTREELQLAGDALVSLVDEWSDTLSISSTTFDVIGFSQGGALATTLAALYPSRIYKMAVLAGFIPEGVDAILRPGLLKNIRCFWAHGTQDELVSFERGRASLKMLDEAGAQIQFCEADVGHRVSKDCRRALDAFLEA
ncbi:MAG: alpha/beta fold hydrolase [Anaerolineae bacterium]|nr:alpha/beta fold hydrolase [Anaerolineae bacterium]MBT7070361.1 alpha/beta fold hydrolase [Anaerolineae bacterium]MBT7324403.1 alpha/beta fold hydrolase [Anaerolineae bacterium]